MVEYDDMTPEERDRFVYLTLSEDALKSIVLIMQKRYGPKVTTDQIMRFAFRVAVNRMTPKHLRKPRKQRPDRDRNGLQDGRSGGMP